MAKEVIGVMQAAGENTTKAQEIAAVSQEQAAAAHEISRLAEDMKRHAARQMEQVGRFAV